MIENWRVLVLLIIIGASMLAIHPSKDISQMNLQFGLDIEGGTRLLLSTKQAVSDDVMQQTIAILNERANVYGLKEMQIRQLGAGKDALIQIETSGIADDLVKNLLSAQGRFEAKIEELVTLSGDSGSIKIGAKDYPLKVAGDMVQIGGQNVSSGGNFSLDGIRMDYVNRTGNTLDFLALAYTGKDIQQVFNAPPKAGVNPSGSSFQFFFSVLISPDGARRFADLTMNRPTYIDPQSGQEYLDSHIIFYIDGKEVSSLNIGAGLKGQIVNEPTIEGGKPTRKDAETESLRLQTFLRSGALPVSLSVASKDQISPTLGADFLKSAVLAAIAAQFMVLVLVLLRYRDLRVALPMVIVAMSEVIIILGIASTSAYDNAIWGVAFVMTAAVVAAAYIKKHADILSFGVLLIPILGFISWAIDLAAIAGVIAAIGTGIDQQIIIADEVIRGKGKEKAEQAYLLKEKLKNAFFIIFGAAATHVAAMTPLLFIGTGLVRGFAITTIIGVLGGYLVTRPAYGAIIEKLLRK